MKHKFLITALASVMLAAGTDAGAVTTQHSEPVQAASFTHYVYSWGDTPHIVVVK